jgi:subtilase family serine protease
MAVSAVATGTFIVTGWFGPAAATALASPAAHPTANCLLPPASCYAPHQFRVAYGIQPLTGRGIDGRGQTIVLVEQASPPPASPPAVTDIRRDLARFDGVFGLPAARLGVATSLAGSAAPWLAGGEEMEDAEVAHAVAPDAAIRIVLVPATATASAGNFAAALTEAVRAGIPQGSVISVSASVGEHYLTAAQAGTLHAALESAREHHVTVVAASGDSGAASDPLPGTAPVKEVSLPASDPLVLAVGGTTLDADNATGAYLSETAWNTLPVLQGGESSASGGGFSRLFVQPGYQNGIADPGHTRGVPDVAADASARSGMAIAVVEGGQQYALTEATGTSAGAPFWAGLVALADQYAGRSLGFINPAVYRIGDSAQYGEAFHDITTGNDTVEFPSGTVDGYQAARGWDPVTGWGTPNAQVLVPLLAHQKGSVGTARP